jgi:dienelactone hydrolase
MIETQPRTGTAAGVPFLAVAPDSPRPGAPVVVAWHLMDAPRTEAAFAAALPLAGLDAWRIYLGLPLAGARAPQGGPDELQRLGYEDAVMNLHGPIARQGADELPAALAELRDRFELGGPLGLVGGSNGAAVAGLVLAEVAPAAGIDVAAAVLVSPVSQLRAVVDAVGEQYGFTYPWTPESLAAADRLDFVARAGDLVAAGQPAVRLVVGADDDAAGFVEPARRFEAALRDRYDDPSRVDLVVIPGMGHALADEPGVDPAPQSPEAAEVDRQAVAWLRQHLGATAR